MNYSNYRVRKYWGEKQNLFNIFTIWGFGTACKGDYGIGVISEFVFSEVTTVLALRKSMDAAKEVGNVLLEAREIEIMKASEVFERSWEIFSNQENTGLSFVDASNLACMEMREIRMIATFDKDFLKIGSVEVVNG